MAHHKTRYRLERPISNTLQNLKLCWYVHICPRQCKRYSCFFLFKQNKTKPPEQNLWSSCFFVLVRSTVIPEKGETSQHSRSVTSGGMRRGLPSQGTGRGAQSGKTLVLREGSSESSSQDTGEPQREPPLGRSLAICRGPSLLSSSGADQTLGFRI